MGVIAKKGILKSNRTAWFHFMDGCEFLFRYINPDEREKLLDAANEKIFDVKQGKQIDRISTAKLAAEIRRIKVIQDWRIKAEVLPQIVDLSDYPEPGQSLPYDDDDCEHLIRYGEGIGAWLLDQIRSLAAFQAAEAVQRKNASSPTPAASFGSSEAMGAPSPVRSVISSPRSSDVLFPAPPAQD